MMFPTASTPPAPPRYRGLDGLRGIAVLLVVAYHLFPGWYLPGGFVGVDVFFVISGFLITSLLLREAHSAGRIRLGGFWMRRARRLLPALAVMVTVCAALAFTVGGDVLVGMGYQVLGAATFSSNWLSIAVGGGYFSATTPELFNNLWSLAVEEQFYLLWPLVLPLFLLIPRAWGRTAAAVLLAASSVGLMAALVAAGGDLTRVYFGTDTHAFGLLLGIALAFALERIATRAPRPSIAGVGRTWGVVLGVVALSALVFTAAAPPTTGLDTFPGSLASASVLTAFVIAAAVWPGSWFGIGLDAQPLRWVGERSYAIYLWHWPLLVLLLAPTAGLPSEVPVAIGWTALVLTFAAAAASYRWVELPVRRYGFRGALRRFGGRLASTPLRRLGAISASAVVVAALTGTAAAIAVAPDVSSGQAAVEAGAAALAEQQRASAAQSGAASTTPLPTVSPTHAPTPAATAPASPPPGGAPTLGPPRVVPGDEVTAIGDSVMLASAPGLLDEFPGIDIDAKVSRSMWAGPGIVERLAAKGRLRDYVVVALGTNGPIDKGSLAELARTVGPDRHLVLVTAHAPRSWIKGVNRDLVAFARAHDNVVIADWSKAIAPHDDLLAGDHIHPGSAGGRIFAATVRSSIEKVEADAAELAYRAQYREWQLTQGLVPTPH